MALSLVSTELARVAHEEAEVLKDERLTRAREGKQTGPPTKTSHSGEVKSKGRARVHEKTTGGKKRDASSAAQGSSVRPSATPEGAAAPASAGWTPMRCQTRCRR